MKRYLQILAAITLSSFAAEPKPAVPEKLSAVLSQVNFGHVAFCRPNAYIDELQIIGETRWLTEAEAKKLAAVFNSEGSWRDKSGKGMVSFCIPHYDFKIVLGRKDVGSVAMRFCTGCRVADTRVNGEPVSLPTMLDPGSKALRELFDSWFPGWAKISQGNYAEWARRDRKTRPRDSEKETK
ncbi:MAG: hypothetical protein JNK23_02565 [Opitutaceae bacterium]|nr:hypothetical protein [Opitutaceae bacterium]